MGKMDEIILVTKRESLFDSEKLTFAGLTSDKEVIDNLTARIDLNLATMRRGDAEENKEWKQPIPYIVFKRGDEVFVYQRLEGGGEARLHGQLSLGVGGHMNPIGQKDKILDLLTENTLREVNEELEIKNFNVEPEDIKIVALINNDDDEVGSVHLGMLGVVEIEEDADIVVREVEQLKGFWLTVDALKEDSVYNRLEDWSKFVVDTL